MAPARSIIELECRAASGGNYFGAGLSTAARAWRMPRTGARAAVDNPCPSEAGLVCQLQRRLSVGGFPTALVCGYPPARRLSKSEGPGTFLNRTPGLLHAGARQARVCIAFMPVMHGVVQSPVERASGCPNSLIGCTTAPAAGSRCASAAVATAATCIAPGAVLRCAGASRCAAPVNATS